MRLSLRIVLVTAAIAVAITALPTAYVLNGPKWATRTVNYYINPANADVTEAAAETAESSLAPQLGARSRMPTSASITWAERPETP